MNLISRLTDRIYLRPILKAVLQLVALLLLVPSLTFLIFHFLPADPVRSALGVNVSEQAVEVVRKDLGLDRPLTSQLVGHLWRLLHFDLGRSLVTGRPVIPDLVSSYALTLRYVVGALLLSTLVSLSCLFVAYFGSVRTKLLLLSLSKTMTTLPSVIVATGVGLFVLMTGALDFIPSQDHRNLLMAVLALSVFPSFSLAEIAINEGVGLMDRPYIVAARSMGFSEWRILLSYVLRVALAPWIGHLSNVAAALVTGSIVMEAIFSLPGLGRLVTQSTLRNDFFMMQGIVTVSVIGFMFVNYVTATLLRWRFGGYR